MKSTAFSRTSGVEIILESLRHKVAPGRLKKKVRGLLSVLGYDGAEVTIYLVGDRKIRRMNRDYLGHDQATDVISFSQWEGRPLRRPKEMPLYLGEIFISLDTTARQALQYRNSFQYELLFYICHGLLHLLGWQDDTVRRRLKMWRKQEQLLKKVGFA